MCDLHDDDGAKGEHTPRAGCVWYFAELLTHAPWWPNDTPLVVNQRFMAEGREALNSFVTSHGHICHESKRPVYVDVAVGVGNIGGH